MILFSFNYAQMNEDSIKVSLDSLLNVEYDNVEYISSASKYSQYYSDAPSSVSIISSKSIKNYGYEYISDALNAQKGFYISDDRNYHYLGVRGFSRPTDYNNKVLFLLNGHRLNDGFYNSMYIGRVFGLNLFNFEQIEIVRGPGSTIYGASSMLATINFVPRKIITGLIPEMKLSIGTFNTQKIDANFGASLSKDLSIFINASASRSDGENGVYFKEFDDIETNNGIAENLDESKTYGLLLRLEYKKLEISGYSSSGRKLIPTASWETDFNKVLRTTDKLQFANISYEYEFSTKLKNISKLSFDKYYYEGIFTYDEERETETNETDSYGFESHFIWDNFLNNRTLFGFEGRIITRANYKYNLLDQTDYIYFSSPYKMYSFYLQNELQLTPELGIYLGIRSDKYSEYENEFSPRVGMVYSPKINSTFKLLFNTAFRVPTVYESDYFDPELNYLDNPDLKPEKLSMIEAIWEYKINKKIKTGISVYHFEIDQIINQIEDEELNTIQFLNTGKTISTGFEVEFNVKLSSSFESFLNYSYQNAEEKNKSISNSPSHMIKSGMSANICELLNISAEYIYNSKRKTLRSSYSDPINIVNLNVRTNKIFDFLSFSFGIKNLFNHKVEYPAGLEHIQNTIPQLPRNFLFSIYLTK